jgi:hypothetical protein
MIDVLIVEAMAKILRERGNKPWRLWIDISEIQAAHERYGKLRPRIIHFSARNWA